jgi:hypothetical protein
MKDRRSILNQAQALSKSTLHMRFHLRFSIPGAVSILSAVV